MRNLFVKIEIKGLIRMKSLNTNSQYFSYKLIKKKIKMKFIAGLVAAAVAQELGT